MGYYWGSYRSQRPDLVRESFQTLFRWYEERKLKPHVSERFDLADAARAIQALRQRKATGKVVLTTGRTE